MIEHYCMELLPKIARGLISYWGQLAHRDTWQYVLGVYQHLIGRNAI